MSVAPTVVRRVMRELAELRSNPPEGVRVVTNEDNMLDVTGIIEGPEGTPYAGGYFKVKFKFTEEFPAAPPKCWFITKIFHPNVSPQGEICVSTLKKDWNPSYGIGHILVTVKCLLIYPNPDSALDEEAGRLVQEDWNSYCERARMVTSVHATPKVPPPEFATPAAAAATTSTPTDPPAPLASTSSLSTTSLATSASAPLLAHKTSVPTSPAQPLHRSPSNNASPALSSENSKDGNKERLSSPAPLGTADSNVALGAAPAAASKAVKRTAGTGGAAAADGQKRKKALKRL